MLLEDVKVIEQFTSWQGEGENQGKKALFFRFGGCNLRCPWCDTKRSWVVKEKDLKAVVIPDDIHLYSLIVVTGGEPLMSVNRGMVERLLVVLDQLGWGGEVEIETNGTYPPLQCRCTYRVKYVVSPKPWGEVWEGWVQLRGVDKVWKFVVNSDLVDFVEGWIEKLKSVGETRIYVMPVGDTVIEMCSNAFYAVRIARKYSTNLSGRLHVLFGIGEEERRWCNEWR